MPVSHAFSPQRALESILEVGTCAGMDDSELISRFLERRDAAGELAFRTLVERHGPMVMRLCRRFLNGTDEAQDAFQAVFLVLARRASAIRNRDSLASWLHGVSVRIAKRARLRNRNRQARERDGNETALALALDRDSEKPAWAAQDEAGGLVHEELEQLPEKFRAPIVLCYLEGLTHDQAAARLRWPVGTVRSRLSRGRDRLKLQLARRGVTSAAGAGVLGGWLACGTEATAAVVPAATLLSGSLIDATVRAASQFATSRVLLAGSVPAATLALTQGMLQTMLLKKLAIASLLVIPLGIVTATGAYVAGQEKQSAPPVASPTDTKEATPPPAKLQDALAQRLLEAARERLKAQKTYYEEGRITLDRFIDASEQLKQAELRVATSEQEIAAAWRKHLELLKQIMEREISEFKIGKGTQADVAEATQRAYQAELEARAAQLALPRPVSSNEKEAIKAVLEVAKKRAEAQESAYVEGKITIDRLISAIDLCRQAEEAALAFNSETLSDVRLRYVNRLKLVEKHEKEQLEKGTGTIADLAEATQARVRAELLYRDGNSAPAQDIQTLQNRVRDLEQKVDQLINESRATKKKEPGN